MNWVIGWLLGFPTDAGIVFHLHDKIHKLFIKLQKGYLLRESKVQEQEAQVTFLANQGIKQA